MTTLVNVLFWAVILLGVLALRRRTSKADRIKAKAEGLTLAQYRQREIDAAVKQAEEQAPALPKKEIPLGVSWVITLMFLGGLGYGVWWLYDQVTDKTGYQSHTRTIDITVSPAWLTGEFKTCESFPVGTGTFSEVVCDGLDSTSTKTMEVEFYGRMEQPEYQTILWKCRRYSQSFTCWQTGGRRAQ